MTVNESNVVHAFRLAPGTGPLFATIKNDERARIKETPVDAEALLPDGPYDLWREDDEARRVKDLAGAFARFPRLPKVLSQKILLDTVLQGVKRGLFVARLARPDGSFRTWWREAVDTESSTDPAKANGISIAQALSQARGRTLPWGLVRESIRAGVESRWLEVAEDSGPVSCGYDNAGSLRLARPAPDGKPPPPPPEPVGGGAALEGSQIQDLADLVPDLLAASAGNELRFLVRVALGEEASSEVRTALDEMLATVSERLKTSGG